MVRENRWTVRDTLCRRWEMLWQNHTTRHLLAREGMLCVFPFFCHSWFQEALNEVQIEATISYVSHVPLRSYQHQSVVQHVCRQTALPASSTLHQYCAAHVAFETLNLHRLDSGQFGDAVLQGHFCFSFCCAFLCVNLSTGDKPFCKHWVILNCWDYTEFFSDRGQFLLWEVSKERTHVGFFGVVCQILVLVIRDPNHKLDLDVESSSSITMDVFVLSRLAFHIKSLLQLQPPQLQAFIGLLANCLRRDSDLQVCLICQTHPCNS